MTKSDFYILLAALFLAPHINFLLSGIFAAVLFVTALFTEDKA